MVILISGATHTGKTALAQKLIAQYHFPCLSLDLLKMGLIRSGNTSLTPLDDDNLLTAYLWPIVREMIKTAIENGQNLIVEGCYIPYDWKQDFDSDSLDHIKSICLVMSERYIRDHFSQIQQYANIVEDRGKDEDCTIEMLLRDNVEALRQCQLNRMDYLLIDDSYDVDFSL